MAARTFALGSADALLYFPATHGITVLNRSALSVFELCDGSRSVAEIATQLASERGLPADFLLADVIGIVEHLEQISFLESFPHANTPRIADQQSRALVGFDGSTVAVEAADDYILEQVRHRFRHLLVDRGEPLGTLVVAPDLGGGFSVRGAREEPVVKDDMVRLIRFLEDRISTIFSSSRPDLLWFHAAAVADDDGAILVVGAPGTGKSTFATELVSRGWRYLSDELVAYDVLERRLLPFPMSPRVREVLRAPVAAEQVPWIPRFEVQVEPAFVQREPVELSYVALPMFVRADEQEHIASAPPALVVGRLLDACYKFPQRGELAIRSILELVSRVRAFSLRYADRGGAVDQLLAEIAAERNRQRASGPQ